jgi:hypothetical protein
VFEHLPTRPSDASLVQSRACSLRLHHASYGTCRSSAVYSSPLVGLDPTAAPLFAFASSAMALSSSCYAYAWCSII